MNTEMSYSTTYASIGSSALQPQSKPYLRLIEGGAGKAALGSLPFLGRAEQAETTLASQEESNLKNMVLATLIVVVTCTLLLWAFSFSNDLLARHREGVMAHPAGETITVQSGDSLWSIAEDNPVEGYSTEEVVQWLKETNQLSSSCLFAGQKLQVPSQGGGE